MNTDNLFEKEGPIYLGSQLKKKNCSIGIVGVNYDGTTCYKPGTRFGPNAIRLASQCLETFCPKSGKDLDEIKYFDFGSVFLDHRDTISVIDKVKLATQYILINNLKPLILGGEHSITSGSIQALVDKYPNLILIQLDAHADLRNSYQNNRFSHACTIQRCTDILRDNKVFQIGIRSGTKEEFEIMNKRDQLIEFNPGDNGMLLKQKLEPFKDFPIYLTIDLDWFDPSMVPGTGTPEPGGLFWHDFETIIKKLDDFKVIGGDIVELSPDIDPSGVSSIVAAKVARSLIITLDKN